MKGLTAIQRLMATQGTNPNMGYTKPSIKELKGLKDSCSDLEWSEMGRQACKCLDEEFEPMQ